eukprot:4628975-Pyramimonas_sp.AAC.1
MNHKRCRASSRVSSKLIRRRIGDERFEVDRNRSNRRTSDSTATEVIQSRSETSESKRVAGRSRENQTIIKRIVFCS